MQKVVIISHQSWKKVTPYRQKNPSRTIPTIRVPQFWIGGSDKKVENGLTKDGGSVMWDVRVFYQVENGEGVLCLQYHCTVIRSSSNGFAICCFQQCIMDHFFVRIAILILNLIPVILLAFSLSFKSNYGDGECHWIWRIENSEDDPRVLNPDCKGWSRYSSRI